MENNKNLVVIKKTPETEEEKIELEHKQEREQQEYIKAYNSDVEFEGFYLSSLLLNRDSLTKTYTEKIKLNHTKITDDEVGRLTNAGTTIIERAKKLKGISEKSLKKYLNDIIIKYPNLKYSLIIDKDTQEMIIEFESKIKIGAFAIWHKFSEAKRISNISDDGKYILFDGEKTGIPTDEITVINKI